VEKVSYLGQPNCYRLSNSTVELIVTTDIGPRIIRYGFNGGENIFGEVPDASVKTTLGEWKPLGGHRLWTAPESLPRSYVPDNAPVEFESESERSIRLTQTIEQPTGIQKEMHVALDMEGSGVTVRHIIMNRNLWRIEVAPWALTIMRGGGETILPQEPYRSWDETVLPARPLVLWHYTDLRDPRWSLGQRFIRLKTDEKASAPQKVGILNKQGWSAYLLGETLFVKSVAYREGANYPDYNSNNEAYTAGSFMELETLAPIQMLEPGESATHVEQWFLFPNFAAGATDEELEASLRPCITHLHRSTTA
jgi:hypothetical protein